MEWHDGEYGFGAFDIFVVAVIILCVDADDFASSCFDFACVVDEFLSCFGCADGEDGCALFDERECAVFELSSCEAFRAQIRYFFDFERSFECVCVCFLSADDEGVAFHLIGEVFGVFVPCGEVVRAYLSELFCLSGECCEDCECCRVCFSACDTDFRAGVHREDNIGHSPECASGCVDDAYCAVECFGDFDHVCGFSALADDDGCVFFEEWAHMMVF